MRPTQRSLLARQRNSSLDGGWNEHSLRSAIRMTTFHRNAVKHRQMFSTARNMRSCTPNNPLAQNCAWVVVWFPSIVMFNIFPYKNQIQCCLTTQRSFAFSLVSEENGNVFGKPEWWIQIQPTGLWVWYQRSWCLSCKKVRTFFYRKI